MNELDLSTERSMALDSIANYVKLKLAEGKEAKVNFICTHNSRRSVMAQIWMTIWAHHFSLTSVTAYSGGTEITETNPRVISMLQSYAGMEISTSDERGVNPVYRIRGLEGLSLFSKKYDHSNNPSSDYLAVMVCTDADEGCPVVIGSEQRVSLPFEDPKVYDDTDNEEGKYVERFLEIGGQLLYVFKRL